MLNGSIGGLSARLQGELQIGWGQLVRQDGKPLSPTPERPHLVVRERDDAPTCKTERHTRNGTLRERERYLVRTRVCRRIPTPHTQPWPFQCHRHCSSVHVSRDSRDQNVEIHVRSSLL